MRKLILVLAAVSLAMALAIPARAEGDFSRLLNWVKKQDIRTGMAYDLDQKLWGATYWSPLSYGSRGLSTGKSEARAYLDTALGAAYRKGDATKGLFGVLLRPLNILHKLSGKAPTEGWFAKDRFKVAKLDKLEVVGGPTLLIPARALEDIKSLRGREMLSFTLTVKFK